MFETNRLKILGVGHGGGEKGGVGVEGKSFELYLALEPPFLLKPIRHQDTKDSSRLMRKLGSNGQEQINARLIIE